MVETSQGFYKHVDTLVTVLVSTGREEVESVFRIKVVVSVEMSSNEIMDFLFRLLMQILKFVHGRELGDIETVGQYAIRFSFQQVLTLVGSDMRNSGEHIAGMSSGTLNAVSVVYSSFSSFSVNIKVLKVVVEIDGTGAQVSAKKGSVGGKNGGYIYAASSA